LQGPPVRVSEAEQVAKTGPPGHTWPLRGHSPSSPKALNPVKKKKQTNPEPFAISSRRKTAPRSSPPPPALPPPHSKRGKIRSRMQPPQTPIPPWGSKSRRELQPSLLSPSYSRKPFQAAAAAASSEHPCVRTRSLFPPFFL